MPVTKKELIKFLEPFSDDIELYCLNDEGDHEPARSLVYRLVDGVGRVVITQWTL